MEINHEKERVLQPPEEILMNNNSLSYKMPFPEKRRH